MARIVARFCADDAEALAGGHEIRRRYVDITEARGLAEDDDRFPAVDLIVRIAISARRADNQVVEAIAVDVAGRRDGNAHQVSSIGAENPEALAG